MRMTTTTWSPDTCDCVMEYEWDRDLPTEERTHAIKTVHKTCKDHKDKHPQKEDHYDYVLDENQVKNKVFDAMEKNLPDSTEDIVEDGETTKRLKKDKEYKWSFNSKRGLEVDMAAFTPEEKAIIRGLNIGTDKTKVVIK